MALKLLADTIIINDNGSGGCQVVLPYLGLWECSS